jgi:UDP-glucose 4-epimerase
MLDVMRKFNVKNIVFSSSATVYGVPETVPIREDFPLSATNPYGRTKLMLEEIFRDLYVSDSEWNIVLLRYFNPIGAHESGMIGEDPNGIPNNLLPYITKVSVGELPMLNVFGDDYDTPDGTCIRDYIHVVDLAKGHVLALKKITEQVGIREYNLGTGTGYSVLDVIKNFEIASGAKVPYQIAPRRAGDVAMCYADATRAKEELGFVAEFDIKRMCEDSYRWQKQNPKGYRS